ncbi:MAG: export protein FliQ family 3, partial [Actinomycetia bacterium]|nr:export protein FliQ family 3 [Actinomycetes bacterium]
LVQSVTQVQEYTLTFVPKLAGIAIVIVVAGSWMLHQLVAFTQDLFARVPTLVR